MRRIMAGFLCLLILSVAGCAAVAVAGAGAGIIYIRGEAKKYFVAELEPTVQASKKVMEEMSLPILGESREGNVFTLRSRRPADATEVKITISPGGESLTEVAIRVGTWGDKEYSAEFLNALESKL